MNVDETSTKFGQSFSEYWYDYLSISHRQAFIAWSGGAILSYGIELWSSTRISGLPLVGLALVRVLMVTLLYGIYRMRLRTTGKAQLFWIATNFYVFCVLCGGLASVVDSHFGLPVYATIGFVITGACAHYPLRVAPALAFPFTVASSFSLSYFLFSTELSHSSLAVLGLLMATSPFSTSFGSIRLHNALRSAYALNRQLAEEFRVTEESKARLDVTISSISEALLALNREGRVELANPPAASLLGKSVSDILGKPLVDVLHLMSESGEMIEVDLTRSWTRLANVSDGSDSVPTAVRVASSPLLNEAGEHTGNVIVLQDISLLRAEEEKRMNQARLESLGVLAGGIAHDFNNLLTVVQGNISLVELEVEQGSPAREPLLETDIALQKARELSNQLLTFSKGGQPRKECLEIGPFLDQSINLYLKNRLITVELALKEELFAEVDKTQISQIFQNLAVNAIQAMPDGGVLRVTLTSSEESVRIIFEDNGPGVPDAIVGKIFDPYFSTKQLGSGLGLATAYSVAQKHEGDLTYGKSELGGAKFTLTLPRASGPVLNLDEGTTGKLAPRALVMDDEPSVLNVTCRILDRLGLSAVPATDGAKALELYRAAYRGGEPFNIVLVDLTVPDGMGGREMIKKLIDFDPDAKAVVASGYSADPVMSSWADYGFVGALAKPYGVQQLKAVLRDLNLVSRE